MTERPDSNLYLYLLIITKLAKHAKRVGSKHGLLLLFTVPCTENGTIHMKGRANHATRVGSKHGLVLLFTVAGTEMMQFDSEAP
jgi:hypothetical protein